MRPRMSRDLSGSIWGQMWKRLDQGAKEYAEARRAVADAANKLTTARIKFERSVDIFRQQVIDETEL